MATGTPAIGRGKITEGDRFGRLVAIQYLGQLPKSRWLFQCDCGRKIDTLAIRVRNGTAKSCGCLSAERISKQNRNMSVTTRQALASRCRERNQTHGMRYAPEYKIWGGMIRRCYVETESGFRNYGARGIQVCDRWRNSFENFYADVGPRPSSDHSIDRIDNDGNYEPGNVRWATTPEQSNNRRTNHKVSYRGQVMTLRGAILAAGNVADKGTVHYRLTRLGWPIERAVETPSPTWSS